MLNKNKPKNKYCKLNLNQTPPLTHTHALPADEKDEAEKKGEGGDEGDEKKETEGANEEEEDGESADSDDDDGGMLSEPSGGLAVTVRDPADPSSSLPSSPPPSPGGATSSSIPPAPPPSPGGATPPPSQPLTSGATQIVFYNLASRATQRREPHRGVKCSRADVMASSLGQLLELGLAMGSGIGALLAWEAFW
ncbi:hypothetical protein T492DRAFT_848862 [Pavlovales sp. CCMP2436]|nr:hypothetical protein T492DRAFT_848862 [Pavlovales sp. CCMP2436]